MSDTNHPGEMPARRGRGPLIPRSPSEALKPERVPEPPRRSRNARGQLVVFLNFVMTLTVLVAGALVAGGLYMLSAFHAPGPLAANTVFTVRPGSGVIEIANALERSSIITDARVFRYVTTGWLREGQTLKAGDYEIKAGASMKDVMELMEQGRLILYSVTLPEGLTVRQMLLRLAEEPALDGDLPQELPPEGSLRPDTYKFSRGAKRADLIQRMRVEQQKLVDQIWERRDPDHPIKSKEDFLTLASIVEKETGKDGERAHVASVFLNRLQKGMRLQSDPTIIYGIFGGDGKPSDRPIYRSDIDRETPYNTYRIDGLPPGPIANPGRAALEAVANPWRTNDLYFVADGSGGHAFAATLDEHNANVRRWRRIEAERAAQQPATPAATQPGTESGPASPAPAQPAGN